MVATAGDEGAPLLGRLRELTLLTSLLDEVKTRGQALVFRGEPGIRKSRLLSEAARAARERGMLVLSASGVQSDPVLVLVAARDGYATRLTEVGLPEHRLTGLDEATASALVDAAAPDLPLARRSSVLREAAGNPLALLELPAAGGDQSLLDRAEFAKSFAADLEASDAAFMADSQVPWGVEALNGAVSEPAWRSRPSWYLVATDDRMIPPPAQRAMSGRAGSTVVEAPGSHSIYVSQPRATADLVTRAAREARVAATA